MSKAKPKINSIYRWMWEQKSYWVGFLNRDVRLEIHHNYRGGWQVSILSDLGGRLFRESDLYAMQDSTIKAAKARASKFATRLPHLLHNELLEKKKELATLAEFETFVKTAIAER